MIQPRIGHIPLEILHHIHSQTHEEMRRREEVVYIQMQNTEQGYITAAKETMKGVREKTVVEAKMSWVKEVVRALSETFPELMVQPKDTVEVVVR